MEKKGKFFFKNGKEWSAQPWFYCDWDPEFVETCVQTFTAMFYAVHCDKDASQFRGNICFAWTEYIPSLIFSSV